MLKRQEIQEIVNNFQDITVGVLGSHSAEEVGIAAKAFGFKTVVICKKGREDLYSHHNAHLFDNVITLGKFSDILDQKIQEKLIKLNTIFIPNRSFSVYVGYDAIENNFRVPIYGNRFLLRAECCRLSCPSRFQLTSRREPYHSQSATMNSRLPIEGLR